MPTEINLMGILKEAMKEEESLWAHIHLSKNKSLDEQMEIIAKWKPKAKRVPDAVANFAEKGETLKKAHAKKQKSGRHSGKDQVHRKIVETRACLARNRVRATLRS